MVHIWYVNVLVYVLCTGINNSDIVTHDNVSWHVICVCAPFVKAVERRRSHIKAFRQICSPLCSLCCCCRRCRCVVRINRMRAQRATDARRTRSAHMQTYTFSVENFGCKLKYSCGSGGNGSNGSDGAATFAGAAICGFSAVLL